MNLTPEERYWMDHYDGMEQWEKELISDTLKDIASAMREYGSRPQFDDRLAKLEAALIRYLIEGRP